MHRFSSPTNVENAGMANEDNRTSTGWKSPHCSVDYKFNGAKIRFPAGPWLNRKPLLNNSHHLSAV